MGKEHHLERERVDVKVKSLPGKIIGVDPGKMNGIAIFNGDGSLDTFGQLTIEELKTWQNEYPHEVSWVIVEDFVLFKKRALQQAGSRMHASQVIGFMETFAMRKGAKFTLSPADNLPTAEKVSGKKMPSQHDISHQVSAYNHAYLWMHKAGIVQSVLEQERLNGD